MTTSTPPNQNDPASLAEFRYERWRKVFLEYVLRLFCIFGLFLFGSIFFSGEPTIAEIAFFGLTYLLLIFFTLAPVPYRIKVAALLASGELIGLYALIRFGPWSDAVIFLLTTSVFAALLFNKRVDLLIFGINAFILVGAAIFDQLQIFPLLSSNLPPTTSGDWMTYIVDYVVISGVLTWALHLLKDEFRTVARQFSTTLNLLNKDRAELEQRVEERTIGLSKKTEQLRAASYIARQTADVSDISSILNIVVNLITDQFGYYHAGIFLISESGEEANLQAASSEGGKQMLERGHSLAFGQGIVGFAAEQKKPRIALDVGEDAVFFNNPDLPMTRSEVALPMLIRNKVIGVLDIQSDQPQAFKNEDIDVLQTLADQVAVAIDNARLLGEAQAALMQLETVSTVRTREAWARKLQEQTRAFTYTPLGMRAESPSIEATNETSLEAPIKLRGQNIGSITLKRKSAANWNKLDEDLINEVAAQVGLAADNLRLLEDAQQRARQEQTIGELATRFSQSLDIDGLLQSAARELGQLPDVAEVSVFIGQLPEQSPQKRRRQTG